MKNKLIKKFFSFSYGSIISMFIGFISVPLLTRLLSPSEYGKVTLFIIITGMLSTILTFGTEQAFVRFYYEEKEQNRIELLRKSILIPLLLCIFFIFIMIFFGQSITLKYFKDDSILIIILLTVQSVTLMINNFALLVVRMQQKGHLYSLLLINNKVWYVVGILFLIYLFNNDYKVAVGSLVFANLIVTLIAVFAQKKYWISKAKNYGNLKNRLRDIIGFSVPLLITLLINWTFQAADKFALQTWTDYTELGIYSSASTFIVILSILQTSFTIYWTPLSFQKYESNSNDKFFFEKIAAIVSLVMLISAVIIVMCRDIMALLLGESYREAIFIMPMLLFIPISFTISETTQIGINFKKKPKYHIIVAVVAAIVDILLLSILVPHYGAKGAAISTALAYLISLGLKTYFSNKLYKVNYGIKKLYFSLFSLYVYMLYLTFNQTSVYSLLIGICLILLYLYFYKVLIIENLQYIKFNKYKFKRFLK